jgi:Kelch motif
MVSSQKDRVMILGGRESDDSESRVVEEIDFIKRNLVHLPPMKVGRAQPSAFLVNDVIYVFGGTALSLPTNTANISQDLAIGEKFALRENKWREVVSRSAESSAATMAMTTLLM